MSAHDRLPIWFKLRSNSNFIVFTVVFAVFTEIVLYGLIVPVFPFALSKRANIQPEDLQRWISVLLGIFGVGTCAGSLFFGRLAGETFHIIFGNLELIEVDKTESRRTPFIAGLSTLMIATLLLWFSRNIILLVVARFFQGFTGACVWSVGMALIVDTMKDEKQGSGPALGYIGMATSFGMILGPSFGGLVYDKGGYNAVFASSLVVIIFDIVLRILIIEKKEAAKYIFKDDSTQPLLPKPALKTSSTTLLAPKSPFIILITTPRILQCIFTNAMEAVILAALESTLPLHLQQIFGYSATGAGFMFAILVACNILSPWIALLCSKYGPKWMVSLGLALAGLILIVLRLPHDASKGSQVLMSLLLLGIGFGYSFSATPLMMEIEFTVTDLEKESPGLFGDEGAMGLAYGFHSFSYAFGSAVGPVFGGFIRQRYGWGVLTLLLGIFSLFTSIPAAYFASGKRLITLVDEEG